MGQTQKWVRALLFTAMLFLAACSGGPSLQAQNAIADEVEETPVFRIRTLETHNGKEGNRAYIAVDGVVHDVTDMPKWANGEHFGGLVAGYDLTDAIKNRSPHGLRVLEGLPVVGALE